VVCTPTFRVSQAVFSPRSIPGYLCTIANSQPDPATGTSTQPPKAPVDEPNTQGVSKADKIRYGQSIQEGGMGGKTTSSSGEANAEGGFGGTKALDEQDESAAKERREQGYGGEKDMDRNIGA
jgi:hypothetical protein